MQQFNSERSAALTFISKAKVLCLSLILTLGLFIQAGAQNFIVNNNGDTHATSPATSPQDGSGNITLRSAVEAATAQTGAHTITFAAGITAINLTLGQMANIGGTASSNITIDGPGMNVLTITQTTAARVFQTTVSNNFNFTIRDLTITLSPAVVINYSGGGGCIQSGGPGSLTTLINVKITNFRNQIGNGGAVSDSDEDAVHSLTITDCVFDNNRCGGTGGAVSYNGLGTGTVNITGTTFSNNSTDLVGVNPGGSGGALTITGLGVGPQGANVLRNTFINNSVINPTSQGGAIMHVNGTMNLNYNRFVGNNTTGDLGDVLYQSGGDAANTVNATNNWWGHNTAPTAIEVSNGPAPVTAPNVTTWLQLKLSAAPTTICATTAPTTSLVTASFLTNSAGTAIPVANLGAIIGLPISYSAILGTLSGAQTTIQASGTATVTFTTNGTAGAASVNGVVDNVPANDPTARASITVNIAPGISTQPTNQTTCAGSTTTFSVAATGTPTPTYQWRKGVSNLSNGATGNGSTISGATTNTLTISNTALADAAADYNVVITNSCGSVTSNNVSLTVKALPVVTAPTVTQPTCTTPTGTIVVNATGASGTIEYSINNGGAYQASATFSGLAPSSTHNIVVRYTASPNCPVAYASNPVTINAVPLAPTVNNPGTTTGTVGTAFSQTFTTTGGLAPITFATTSTLPTGLTLSSAGVLSGTPTQSGTFPIVVKATDANGCVGTGATYNLVISCQTITVTNPGVAAGTNGTAFSQTFTQTGALGGATFTVFSGTLPNGLTLSAAGVLSGTPSAPAGTYPLVIRVTDGNGCFSNGPTYNLVISCQTITVTNPVVTTGQLGIPFSQTFTQTGGIGATTFSTASTLPGGITLSSAGVLSGTPTATGTFPIVVKATDANGCFANGATYTLVITACPVNDQTVTAVPASVCSGGSSTITVGASQPGVNYTLRIDPANTVVAGPSAGSGAPINFPTGPITSATTYNILAETDAYSIYLNGGVPGPFIPQNAALDVTDNFTIEGWIKPDGNSDFARLFNKDGCYALGISGNQTQLTFTRHGSGDFSRPFTFVSGTWYHIASTYVGGTIELFVNGASIGTVSGVPPIVTNGAGGHIGSDASGNFNRFRGNLDNIRIWNSVRTQAQISTNQSAYLTSTGNPSLVASWWIIEGSGDVKDYSANAINSNNLGGAVWMTDVPVAPCSIVLSTKPTVAITPDNTITLTSAAGTNNQAVCVGGAITTITYSTTGATGATFGGLPAGVTGNWAANVVTISGTPPVTATTYNYTVNLTGGCGTVSTTGSITVNPVATVNTVSNQTVCNGSPSTNITFSSPTPGGTIVYNWTNNTASIGLAASGSGNIAPFIGINGTNAPVTATITVTPAYTNGGTTCNGTPTTFTITVNPSNTIAQVGSQTLCNGATTAAINFSSTATGGTVVYNWTGDFAIGLPSSGSGNIPPFTAINTGTTVISDTIRVTAAYTNGGTTCTSAIMLFVITVNPTPDVNTVANQTVCNGAPTAAVNYTGAVPGTVYQWTNNTTSIGLAASGTGNIPSFTGTNATAAPVTATVTVTPIFLNESIQGSLGPGDLTMPNRLFRDGIASTCANKAFPGTSAGAHYYDSYSFVNTTGQAQCVNILYRAKSTGDVFVAAYNNSFNPGALSTNYLGDGGLSSIASSTSSFSVTVAAGATLVVVALEANSAPCPQYIMSVTGLGMVCTGTPKTFTITVNPTPTVNAVGNQVVCNGASTTAVNFSGATAGTVYNWTNNTPSIGLAASGTGNIGSFTATNATAAAVTATITVTPSYTNNGTTCTGTPTTFTITVNPTATINAVANQVVCNTQSTTAVTFSSPTTGGTIVYNWTNNTTSIGLAASGSGNIASFVAVNTGTAPVVATITVTPAYTNGSVTCNGTPITFTITVNPPPATTCPGNITTDAPTNACSAVVTYTATGSGTVTYAFTGATVASGSGTGSGSAFNVGVTTVTITSTSSCGTSNCTFTVTVNDVTPPTITCPAQIVVCGSQVVNYPLPTVTDNCTVSSPLNLTQTASNTITPSNSVSCNNGAGHTANSYWRVYDLAALGLTGPYTVNKVVFGIESANTASGSQPATIRVHTLTGAFTLANLTQVASQNIVITNQSGTLMTVTLTTPPTVAANAKLVLEVFTPDGRPTSSLFYMGSNTGAQTAPNYISAPDCGVTDPIDVSSVGYPNMRSVLNAEGVVGGAITPVQTAGLPSGSVFPVGTTVNTYTATDGSGNTSSCSFNVIVNPIPSVNAVTNQVVCNGAPTTAITFNGPVAGTVYSWTNNTPSIGLAASGSGNIASFNAINTTAAAVTATITVTPSYTNAGTTCTGTPITFTITVNPTPTVNAVANQVVCNGAPTTAVTFTGATAGTVYNWTNNTTSIGLAASGTGNIASFNGINATNAPVTATITVTPSYTNAGTTCTGTPITFTITVNPTATINTVANQVVCNGANTTAVTFSSPTTGGTIVYNWVNNTPSIGLGASGSGNIASFVATNTTTAPVTATITVTPSYTNGAVTCTGTPITFTITVNPTATVNAVANQVVCNNANTTAVTFSSPTTGGTIVYNWTNNTPSIGLAGSGSGNIASFVATNTTNATVVATITVTPSYTSGSVTCTGTPITFTITVNPTPTVNTVANQTVCNGAPTAAITFSGFVPGTVYSWTNNTTSIGLAASGTGNIASFNGINPTNAPVTATITVTPSYTNAGTTCTGTPTTFTITVNPTPIVDAVISQTVCNGGPTTDVNFTTPTTGGTIVYNWTNNTPSIGLAASGSGDILSFTGTNATNAPVTATITVTPSFTNNGVTCTGAPITFTITVNPTPVINPVANQTVCNNANTAAVSFSSPTTGGTIVYNWSNNMPSIGLASTGSGNIASFVAVNNGIAPVTATITVIPSYTNNGVTCTGPSISFDITVNPTPSVNPVADQAVCNGTGSTPVTFTSPIPATVFNWTNSNTAIGLGASGTGNIASFTGTNAGVTAISGTITVTPTYTNGGTTCTGTPITFVITINPTPTVNAVANQTVCNNSSTAAVTFAGAVAGTVYNWTNNNTSIGLAANGTGNIASFTATNITNAAVTATITVTPSFTNAGTTCTGTPRTFTITVNPTPTVTAVANQVVCNGTATAAVTFTGAVTGTVFNWTNNTTSIGLAASGTGNIASFTAVNTGTTPVIATITVTPSYTNGGTTCTGTPITFTITVNPTTVIATQPTNVTLCEGGTATFTVAATGTALTYQWQVNTGAGFNNIAGATAATYIINPTTAAMNGYQYHVIVTGTCGVVTSNNVTLTVNTAPVIVVQPVNTPGCIGGSVTFGVTATGTALTYQWQINTGSGFTNIPGAIAATYTQTGITAAMAGYQYRVIVSGTCPPSRTSNPATLTVNVPAVITVQPASLTICFGASSATFSVTATGSALTYQWQVNNGAGFTNIPGATSNVLVIPNPSVLISFSQYRVIVTGPCNSLISNTATLIVFSLPNISFSRVPPRVCLTDTIVNLQAEPAGGTWTGRGVLPGSKFSATAAGTGVSTLTYTVVNANGCISIETFNVTVNDCKERHNGLKDGIKIYPNPSNGKFFVKWTTDQYTDVNMMLINSNGENVKSMHFSGLTYGSIIPIDARSLASGMYTLRASNGGDIASFRIVIMH